MPHPLPHLAWRPSCFYRGVTDLPLNAKLREMQQHTHGLVQLIRAATPYVPNQTSMPQLSKWSMRARNQPCTSLYDCCRAVKVPFFFQ